MRKTTCSRTLFTILALLLLASACGKVEAEVATDGTLSGAAAEPAATAVSEKADVPAPAEAAAPTPVPPTAVAEPSSAPEPTDIEPQFVLQGEIGLTTLELNDMIAFVEDSTGREFLRPPVLIAETKAEFEAGITPTEEEREDFEAGIDGEMRKLHVMGLSQQSTADAAANWLDLMTSTDGILGYYDIEQDDVHMPIAADVDDQFRSTMVHELVHALDGQHVDLVAWSDRMETASDNDDFDEMFAMLSILEGRAVAVQLRWEQVNGVLPVDELPAGLEEVPPAAVLATALPYALGAQYVELNGGASQTWDLYTDGPSTSEAILTGRNDQPEIDVAVPPADGELIVSGPFGAIDLFLMLIGDSLEPSPVQAQQAFMALDGWAGGQIIVWGDDAESCMRLHVAGDNPAELAEIETVLAAWADNEPDVRSIETTDELVKVTGCAPYLP